MQIHKGTLYYDDPADLNGDWDIEVIIAADYANVNFIKDGRTIATYQSGGIGFIEIGSGRFS